ncbi:hypothetical protein KPH14_011905 [Odynerus spinipes]|uniref:Immunoglobulin domain-containing protein n=1 Tax=Odynerus spinipes TaxID=1348599 RepID=A0AAD9VJ73_9HYME|nr:hypothetical protein KPH14_011905 [Odynerus spinipes]
MQLRHTEKLNNEISCYVRTPMKINCNLKAIEDEDKSGKCDDRIDYWTENGECGVLVKNVNMDDMGMWRVTSKNSTRNRLVDVTYVEVLNKIEVMHEQQFIWTGLSYTIMFENTDNYCIVKSPTEKIPIIARDACNVELQSASMVHDGNWQATVAVPGQMYETVQEIKISVSPEHLESGYKWHDNTTLHLYCNVVSDEMEIKLCRFYNSARNETGLRLKDGLRKDKYGYYGNGLANGECGLTIYGPEESDYGLWYCNVILMKETMFTTSIWVPNKLMEFSRERIKAWSITPVLTAISKDLELKCFSNIPLAYCWFLQPNGESLRPSLASGKKDTSISLGYSYEDKELSSGICTLKITNVDVKSSGTWTCNMGPTTPGAEVSTEIVVRVADTPLAAKNKDISTRIGDMVTLECNTVPRPATIHYCRFRSPRGLGININEEITELNSFRWNNLSYWFSGKSLKSGDCGLVIDKINLEHIGEWTCAALLETEEDYESFDTINVIVEAEDIERITASAATGIGAGVVVIIGLLVALVIFIKKKCNSSLNIPTTWRQYRQETPQGTICFSSQPPTPPELESNSD